MPSGSTSHTGRLPELDAMRGIAAFTVVLSHAADDLRTQGGPIPGVHVPLLLAMRHWLDGILPHHAILLSWIVVSIPAACALHRIAEEPARRLASGIGRRTILATA